MEEIQKINAILREATNRLILSENMRLKAVLGEASIKKWDSKFMSSKDAGLLGDKRFKYVPFHELTKDQQRQAVRMYSHKKVGAKYDFIDEHYYYPLDKNGNLPSGSRGGRRVLAIPYKLIQNEKYMASLGYEINPGWNESVEIAVTEDILESEFNVQDVYDAVSGIGDGGSRIRRAAEDQNVSGVAMQLALAASMIHDALMNMSDKRFYVGLEYMEPFRSAISSAKADMKKAWADLSKVAKKLEKDVPPQNNPPRWDAISKRGSIIELRADEAAECVSKGEFDRVFGKLEALMVELGILVSKELLVKEVWQAYKPAYKAQKKIGKVVDAMRKRRLGIESADEFSNLDEAKKVDLYALVYGDGSLYGVTDNPRGTDYESYWRRPVGGDDETWAIYRLKGVPEDIAAKLMVQGTSDQEYSDGYKAWDVASKYAKDVMDMSDATAQAGPRIHGMEKLKRQWESLDEDIEAGDIAKGDILVHKLGAKVKVVDIAWLTKKGGKPGFELTLRRIDVKGQKDQKKRLAGPKAKMKGWSKVKKEDLDLTEGTWAVPDTPAKMKKLLALLKKPLPVGVPESDKDKNSATEKLRGLLGDDYLFDAFHDLYDAKGPKADARPLILKHLPRLKKWMERYKMKPDVIAMLSKAIKEDLQKPEAVRFMEESLGWNETEVNRVLRHSGYDDAEIANMTGRIVEPAPVPITEESQEPVPFRELLESELTESVSEAENRLRDMFQSKKYKGTIPDADIQTMLASKLWHKIAGSEKNLQKAWKNLQDDDFVEKKGKNWVWTLGYLGSAKEESFGGGDHLRALGWSESQIGELLGQAGADSSESVSFLSESDVFLKHQVNIAVKTLKMHKAGASIMGGMNHKEAVKVLRKAGWSDKKIKDALKKAGHDDSDISDFMKEEVNLLPKVVADPTPADGFSELEDLGISRNKIASLLESIGTQEAVRELAETLVWNRPKSWENTIHAKNCRIRWNDRSITDRMWIEELPGKPVKRRVRYSLFQMPAWISASQNRHLSAFLIGNLLRDAKLSKSMNYDKAVAALEKAVGKAYDEVMKAPGGPEFIGKMKKDIFVKGFFSGGEVSYLQVEPDDFTPLVIHAKDFTVGTEWNEFSAYSPESDFQSHDPSYTQYASKSPTGARKFYKIVRANPDVLKHVSWGKFGDWLKKNKIPYDIHFSQWR